MDTIENNNSIIMSDDGFDISFRGVTIAVRHRYHNSRQVPIPMKVRLYNIIVSCSAYANIELREVAWRYLNNRYRPNIRLNCARGTRNNFEYKDIILFSV